MGLEKLLVHPEFQGPGLGEVSAMLRNRSVSSCHDPCGCVMPLFRKTRRGAHPPFLKRGTSSQLIGHNLSWSL